LLCEAHKSRLSLRYAIDPERLEIRDLEKTGLLKTVGSEEIEQLSGWRVDGPGLYIGYPGNGTFVIRPDTPLPDGPKYIHPKGEPNHVFVPPGLDLAKAQDLWITEGELKALAGSLQGLPIVALGGVWNWKTAGEEASLLAKGEKLKDKESLLPELAQVSWAGKRINLLYDSDIVPGHKARDAFPRLAEQLYRLGAEEVRILTLPPGDESQKVGLDDFILDRGPEQALQDLQAIRSKAEPYLPWRDGGLAFAERLIKSQDLEDKQKAVVAYLGAKGEVFTLDWLKHQAGLQSDVRKALISEAKKRLKVLQSRPKASSSQEPPSGLGPEYDHVKTLLQPIFSLEQYGMDELGRLGRFEWETTYEDGEEVKELVHKHFCNFAAWPVREILKDSGAGEPEKFLELQGLLQGGTPLQPRTVSLTEFMDKPSSCLGKAWGVSAAIKPRQDQDLRYLLQIMSRGIPKTTIYTHLGWKKIEGSWAYLHAGGAVGSEAVEVEINERLQRYKLPNKTKNIKTAIRASLSLVDLGPKAILYPLYAGIWLAPLCEPLRQAGIEPSHLTYLWGESGSGKSSLIALLLSHFGDFNKLTLPASFKDTKLSIPEMAFVAKDTILVVDDLYPAQDPRERTKLEGILEHLSRNQGDRQGRGRLKSTSELMTGHPPRGIIYSTGEYLSLLGSSLIRTISLRIQRGQISEDAIDKGLDPLQKALLSEAMVGFLTWLAPQIDALPSDLLEDFETLRKNASKEAKIRGRHGRLNDTVAYLFLSFNLFIKFAVSTEAISQEEATKLLQDFWKTINRVADELSQVAERVNPTKRFFEAIIELQTQGRVYFATMEGVTPDIAERTLGAVRIGWGPDKSGIYYLLWGPTWEAVTKYLRAQEETLPISKPALLDSIEQQGLLVFKQGERRSVKTTIAGEDVRVLPIDGKAFKLEGENDTL